MKLIASHHQQRHQDDKDTQSVLHCYSGERSIQSRFRPTSMRPATARRATSLRKAISGSDGGGRMEAGSYAQQQQY
jgi:hypothetical protein